MGFYTDKYDIRRLIERCQKMDLLELIEFLRKEIKSIHNIKKSEDTQRYKSLLVELEAFLTGEPRLVSNINKEYIRAVIQHFVLENKINEEILQYLE